jgi:RNA polymerase sigma factor (sigma-70 family)
MAQPSQSPIEHLLRELAPQVLGVIARRFRDFPSAEDAVQEAMLAAFTQWPGQGVPENPRGWLIQVASRRMTDQMRSEMARRQRETAAANDEEATVPAIESESDMDPDDTLILLFMCCHPAITSSSAIALTLRAVGGLTTAEIAKAFLVPEATMAQRISRAKQSIKASSVPFRLPSPKERAERLPAVLHVLYLIFNEGYASSAGAHLQRLDLAREAIRLTRCARMLLPEDGEVAGLLALMLLTDARRAARTGPDEELIPLNKQDRALWDRTEVSEGIELLTAALSKGAVGLYQLQAAIAAVHDEAGRSEDTDWPQILALYELLNRVSPGPMVTLNHAIATAMVHGPSKGLEQLKVLDGDSRLAEHHRLDAVRAHLFEMLGDRKSAVKHYRAAAGRTTSIPEQNYLMTQAARLEENPRGQDEKTTAPSS